MNNRIKEFVKENYVYLSATFLAIVMVIGAWKIGEIGPFGGRCLVIVDGVHQYLPFFSEYQEKLTSLSSMQYTYDVGLGNNFLSLWSYYLSSPFNLLILLFSKKNLPMALNIIISLKLIVAAPTFSYFLVHAGKKKEKNYGIVLFSLFYVFSSFVVGYYWNLMWLDCVFIFPIIILGMQKMLVGKDSRLYIGALLYSFICNYYISFMICLFLILWFFTFHFKGVKDFFAKGIRFALASLTSAALSAVVLLPAYKGIMTTASAKFSLPEWKFYGAYADTLKSHLFCSEVVTNQSGDAGTNLYCGLLTVLLGIMFFFMKNIKISKKIKYGLILILMIMSFNNQLLNYIWHGFHNQYGIPNRFAFLYIFVLILMAYEVYLKRDEIPFVGIIVSYIITMVGVIFTYYHAETVYDSKIYVSTAIFLSVYLLLLSMQKKMSNKLVPGVLIMIFAIGEMMANGWMGFYQDGSSDPKYYYGDTEAFVELRDRVEELDNSPFYRSDILEPLAVDEATWYNLKSIGIFGSTVRGELVSIMGNLGFYTGANEYLYYGANPVTNALFGVKYVYTRDGDFNNLTMSKYDSNENISVYKNENALPLGYMVNDDVLEYSPGDNGPFTVNNELAGALSGIQPIFTTIYADMQTDVIGCNVEAEKVDDYNAKYDGANSAAVVDMVFKIPYDMDVYFNCSGSNIYKVSLRIDGTEVAYDRYQGQIFHVGKVKEGQLVDLGFEINEGKNQSGTIYCYPMEFYQSQFDEFYNVLNNRSMNVTKCTGRKIEGTIHAEDGQIFMTSIPYDEGWTIYANGKKVETISLVDGFLGAKLPQGDYTINMVYQCPGLVKGAFTTIIGVICFILIILFEKNMREKSIIKENEKSVEREAELHVEE